MYSPAHGCKEIRAWGLHAVGVEVWVFRIQGCLGGIGTIRTC